MLSKAEALALCRAEHGDPFAVLGLHPDSKGRLWLRTLQPGASAAHASRKPSAISVTYDRWVLRGTASATSSSTVASRSTAVMPRKVA